MEISCLIGNTSSEGPFSIAMLVYQRVDQKPIIRFSHGYCLGEQLQSTMFPQVPITNFHGNMFYSTLDFIQSPTFSGAQFDFPNLKSMNLLWTQLEKTKSKILLFSLVIEWLMVMNLPWLKVKNHQQQLEYFFSLTCLFGLPKLVALQL